MSKNKILKKLITLVLILSMVLCNLRIQVNATSKSQNDAIAWVQSQVGKSIDYDGVYGAQCVDLILAYYNYLGVTPSSGNGADYTHNALPAGWQRLQGVQPQKGDILVYTNGYGHVAIYESDYSTYHQNFNSIGYVQHVTSVKYNQFTNPYWGVIRPNWGVQSTRFTNVYVENVTETTATIKSDLDAVYTDLDKFGAYLGTNPNSLSFYKQDPLNGGTLKGSSVKYNKYDLTGLTPGTTYYYRFFYNIYGSSTIIYSDIKSFTTPCTHNYSSSVTTQPTCTSNGVRTYRCTKCGNSYTSTISALGHSYVNSYVSPGNTSAGYTIHKCSRCGNEYRDNYVQGNVYISLDKYEAVSPGIIRIAGWAVDPQHLDSAVRIDIYTPNSNGQYLATIYSNNVYREDVNKATGTTGKHGFDYTFSTNYVGYLKLSLCAIDFDGKGNREIESSSVYIEARNGWIKENNQWYYYENGSPVKGWKRISGIWYYMNAEGVMTTGWQKISNKWYYMNSSGAMLVGWQKINNQWYYLGTNGAMTTGWQLVGGQWYYMNSSGAMTTGWQKINGYWYYMNSSGAMQIGWIKLGNYWYYLETSGKMVSNCTKVINGKVYRFDSSGHMI